MKKLLIGIFIITLWCNLAHANSYKDSLWKLYNDTSRTEVDRAWDLSKLIFKEYLYRHSYDSAELLSNLNIEVAKKFNDSFLLTNAEAQLGYAQFYLDKYTESLKHLKRSQQISLEIKDTASSTNPMEMIAAIYLRIGNPKKALSYYNQLISIKKKFNEPILPGTQSNVGVAYLELNEHNRALNYFRTALGKINHGQGNQYNEVTILSNIARIHKEEQNQDSAFFYYSLAIEKAEELGISTRIAQAYIGIGNIKIKQKEYEKAIDYCKTGYENSLRTAQLTFQKSACECLYRAYKTKDDGLTALKYYEKMNIVERKLNKQEAAKKLQLFEIKKQQEIDSLRSIELDMIAAKKAKDQLDSKKRKNRIQYSLVVIIVLLLATAIAIFTKFRISPRLASGLIFIFFILTFEFLLVVLDPWVDSISNGEVGWKIAINTGIALVLFGIHQVSEKRLKKAILKTDI